MIVVLADDFSGAAEVAGIAVQAGWSVEVQTEFCASSSSELVVVDTDSRSLPPADAARRVAETVHLARAAGATHVFKKIDSVLRGPVAAELCAAREAGGFSRVILLPANPLRGRVIVAGQYLVGGVPLDQTLFADDPEHPARASRVIELLGDANEPIEIASPSDATLPASGIVVAEASSSDDVRRWASRLDPRTLAAGAAEFFAEWLRRLPAPSARLRATSLGFGVATPQPQSAHESADRRDLFVCGSAAAWSRGRCDECRRRGVPVVVLDDPPCPAGEDDAEAIRRAVVAARAAFFQNRQAMIALGDSPRTSTDLTPRARVEHLARAVAELLAVQPIDRLLVEGGMTAAAVARRLGWRRFVAGQPIAPGVTPLTVHSREPGSLGMPALVPKPGSYDWPAAVWGRPPGV